MTTLLTPRRFMSGQGAAPRAKQALTPLRKVAQTVFARSVPAALHDAAARSQKQVPPAFAHTDARRLDFIHHSRIY
jgi:hypothetical protein